MRKFGLIGYPLSHSFSPGYFRAKFEREGIADARYDLYPLEEIGMISNMESCSGLNVTIPYKEQVIPYLDGLSPEAEQVGAVNTILNKNGNLRGYNTDVYGFERSLTPLISGRYDISALILGTGGAAKAVRYVLDQLVIPWSSVSRSRGEYLYGDLTPDVIKNHHLIINTTPLGMSPRYDQCPEIPYEAVGHEHILYDLIYNPEKTLFLQQGQKRGATIKNGLQMLELQAEKAWQIWNTP